MSFTWPVMLFSLLLVPFLAAAYLVLLRRRRQTASRYSRFGLVQGNALPEPGFRRHIPPLLSLVALTILLVSLARPQASVSIPRVEGTVILAFDVSGSMAAEDLQPSRMEAAKAAAREFVERQPASVRIGVVAFSDNGFAVQAPTNNQEEILAAINRLSPQRGTALAHGITASLNVIEADQGKPLEPESGASDDPAAVEAMQRFPSTAIVLLSDGENNEAPDPSVAAIAAAERRVRVYTIGIGSATGAVIEVEGFSVHTRLEEEALQHISQISRGAYYRAGNTEDLQAVYDDLETKLVVRPEKMEITSLLAGAGVLLLLISGVFSFLWFGRLP